MEFQSKAHEQCYEKVKKYATEIFGEQYVTSDDAPVFLLPHGSAMVHIIVSPWGDDDATIVVRSFVVRGPRVDSELMSYLLHKNDSMRFGAFGLDSDDDIFFEHSFVGSTCDKEEFKASALAVATTADLLDDEIVEKWGGEKAMDTIGKAIGSLSSSSTETAPEKKSDGFSVLRAIDEDKKEDEKDERPVGKSMKKCPECGTEYPPDTRWCEKDGSDLTDS